MSVIRCVLFATAVTALGALGPASAQQRPTFPSDVELVNVDAVVVDDDGEPVADLTREDFELRDEGEPREVLSFEVLDMNARPEPRTRIESRKSPNVESPTGRVFAILWDELHLSPLVGEEAKEALRPWAESRLGSGDRLVLATTGGLWRVAEGLEDWPALLGAIDGLKGARRGTDERDYISDYEAVQIYFREDNLIHGVVRRRFEAQGVPGCGEQPGAGSLSDPCPVRERAAETARGVRNRLLATVRTLDRLCQALSVARGRKSVVLVSEGFTQDLDLADELAAVTRAAQEANVVVTFLDPGGIRVTGGISALMRGPPVATDGAIASAVALADEAGAERVAHDTGGLTIRYNDIPGGLERIARESQVYYLLGFAPAPGGEPGSFRNISLKVRRSRLNVRARRGYTVGTAAPRPPEEELRRLFDAPYDIRERPLRLATWVFEPQPPNLSRVMVGIDVAFSAESSGVDDVQETLDLSVEVQGAARRWRQDRELAFQSPTPAVSEKHTWYLSLMEFALPPGDYRARAVVRARHGAARGAVGRSFQVPSADTWHITTPLLSPRLLTVPGAPGAAPMPTTLREFEVGGTLHGQFVVYGSALESASRAARLSGHWSFRRALADALVRSGPLNFAAAADGGSACRFGVPLDNLPEGDYELTLHIRDEAAGQELEHVEPVILVPRPATEVTARERAPSPGPQPASGDPNDEDHDLHTLLKRAGQYVVDYARAFGNLVAEETYTQEVYPRSTSRRDGQRRITRSDLVFVRLDNDFLWGSFRDVFEVDGRAVRDREARLERLFLEPTASGIEQAREILRESAAYNIGPAVRTVNLPTLPLAFLHPRNQERFSFEVKGHRRFDGTDGVEVQFEEVARPTLVRGENSSDLPARGSFWIEPDNGTVLRTETRFLFPPARATASMATQYRPEPALGMWVPSEMREEYGDIPGSDWPLFRRPSEATARYSNYRRFGVTVEVETTLSETDEP